MTSRSLLCLALALAGCAAPPAAPPTPPASATARPSDPAVAGKAAVRQQSCGTHVVAGDADNGASVCVVAGSDVSILLKTVAGSPWAEPAATGHALGPATGLPTPYGRVGWGFGALAAGSAEISTTRPGSPPVGYRLHVTVR
ncbi:hypothetical protein ODJ79_02290 [Actinoplanes sp. KI2]|uniref:hypothetical protein n=1 Tax=Actinoplanes sp. KI2 TaxID=2983315 RepID=UPI0021D5BD51|nr:hypothetical protein [Actinoplanes sp. KI2]MCU7722535.1 hypothetical protein [Actinoplanes sp. KI2]